MEIYYENVVDVFIVYRQHRLDRSNVLPYDTGDSMAHDK